MFMQSSKEDLQIMMEAKEALAKINSEQNHKKDLLEESQKARDKFDKGRKFYEVYSPEAFQNKMKIDLLYVNQMLQKLENSQLNEVEILLSDLYKDVREIYEYLNIKPELYGANITEDLIVESEENVYNKLSKNIYNYVSHNFYDLDLDKRHKVYFERAKEDIKNLILEGIDAAEASEYAIKKCIMEDLLQNIIFPFSVKSRLNYILEDDAYGDVFDQDALKESYDNFNIRLKALSKIVAACV